MQSIDSSASTRSKLTGSKIGIAIMVILLLVAIIFAANENDVIGWLVVIVAAGWLVLATVAFLWARATARKVTDTAKSFQANLASRNSDTVRVVEEPTDPMRDTKLDHSFKIIEVQKRVITQEMAKGSAADNDVIERALETIEMTAHNGRDMINPDRHSKNGGDDNPNAIEGEVL